MASRSPLYRSTYSYAVIASRNPTIVKGTTRIGQSLTTLYIGAIGYARELFRMPDARDSVPAPSASRMKGPEAMVDIGSEEADKPSQQSHSGSEVHVGKQTTSRSGSNGSREAGRTPHQQLGRTTNSSSLSSIRSIQCTDSQRKPPQPETKMEVNKQINAIGSVFILHFRLRAKITYITSPCASGADGIF